MGTSPSFQIQNSANSMSILAFLAARQKAFNHRTQFAFINNSELAERAKSSQPLPDFTRVLIDQGCVDTRRFNLPVLSKTQIRKPASQRRAHEALVSSVVKQHQRWR